MRHLARAGGLLAMFVIGFVAIFLGVRSTSAFEWFGFYRERHNVEEWASLPIHYLTSSQCNNCHQYEYQVWEQSKHSTVDCETCHGPAEAHLEGEASLVMDTSREFCGLCHNELLSRPNGFPQVDLDTHGGEAECVTCHDRHNPGVAVLPPHELEGRQGLCLMCHEVGGLVPFDEDHLGRTVDTCMNCHKGLRPPHILDASRLDNCLVCHEASGPEPFPEDHAGRSVDTCLFCHHRS